MDLETDVSLKTGDVSTIPENSLGLFLLDIWSMLEASDQREIVAIGPEMRWQQELVIDRHDFGLVWTTTPVAKVDKWVKHGGGYESTDSDRILMGVSDTEHWATAEPVSEAVIYNFYFLMANYPKRINPQCRLRSLIVNPRVIADEGLMPECVTRNDEGDIIIGDGFLAGVEASSVWFVGAEDVVSIGKEFLANSKIQSVCLHGLCNLTSIGDDFLVNCTSLCSVSFEDLNRVISLGDRFLGGCTSLVSVSFEGLSSLTTVGHRFLDGCTSLTCVLKRDYTTDPEQTNGKKREWSDFLEALKTKGVRFTDIWLATNRQGVIRTLGITDAIDIAMIETKWDEQLKNRKSEPTIEKGEQLNSLLLRQMRETEENNNYPHLAKLRTTRLELQELKEKCEGNNNGFKEALKENYHSMLEAKSLQGFDAMILHYLLSDDEKDPLRLAYMLLRKKKEQERITLHNVLMFDEILKLDKRSDEGKNLSIMETPLLPLKFNGLNFQMFEIATLLNDGKNNKNNKNIRAKYAQIYEPRVAEVSEIETVKGGEWLLPVRGNGVVDATNIERELNRMRDVVNNMATYLENMQNEAQYARGQAYRTRGRGRSRGYNHYNPNSAAAYAGPRNMYRGGSTDSTSK